MREATAILLFSSVFGAVLMYAPNIVEFFWAFSRSIDVVVEVPQLKRVYNSEKLDRWIIAYYCCIGARGVIAIVRLALWYRFVENRNGIPARELIRLDSATSL